MQASKNIMLSLALSEPWKWKRLNISQGRNVDNALTPFSDYFYGPHGKQPGIMPTDTDLESSAFSANFDPERLFATDPRP